MAYRLKSRELQIPGGFRFTQPQTKWQSTRFASFASICGALRSHRLAHPDLVQKYGWATDPDAIAEEVDHFNARLCQQMGWLKYIQGGEAPAPPLPARPPLPSSVRLGGVVAGAKVLVDWIASGAEAVPPEQAERRAVRCAACPLNQSSDLSRFFTVPVSAAIRSALNLREGWSLKTSVDDQLGVCDGCLCPLKLKVHVPIQKLVKQMDATTHQALHPQCWVLSEIKGGT